MWRPVLAGVYTDGELAVEPAVYVEHALELGLHAPVGPRSVIDTATGSQRPRLPPADVERLRARGIPRWCV